MVHLTDIVDKVRAYQPQADFDLLHRAFTFAAAKHEGQSRKSGDDAATVGGMGHATGLSVKLGCWKAYVQEIGTGRERSCHCGVGGSSLTFRSRIRPNRKFGNTTSRGIK